MEQTFIMVKPDGVRRKLVGEIIKRLEDKGFELVDMKMLTISADLAAEHYREHQGRDYYRGLIDHITSGPVVAMAWQGPDVVEVTRLLVGHRHPRQALPGTIRGDYAATSTENLVHAADSSQAAARELKLFFPQLGDSGGGK